MDDRTLIGAMGTRIGQYTVENANLRERVSYLEENLANAQAAIDLGRIEELERERDRLKEELQTSALTTEQLKRVKDRQTEELKARCQKLEMEACVLQSDRDQTKDEWRKSIAEVKKLSKETENLKLRGVQLRACFDEVEADNARTKREKADIHRQLAESLEIVKTLRAEKTAIEQTAENALRERDQLCNQLDEHVQKLVDEKETHARQLTEESDAHARQLVKLRDENASLRCDLAEVRKLESRVGELGMELIDVIKERDDAKSDLAECIEALKRLHQELKEAQQNTRSEAERSKLLKEIDKLSHDKDSLDCQLAVVRADATSKSKILDAATAEVAGLQQDLRELRPALEEAEKIKAKLEKDRESIMKERDDLKAELAECVVSLKQLEEEKSVMDQAMGELQRLYSSWRELSQRDQELYHEKESLNHDLEVLQANATEKLTLVHNATTAWVEVRKEAEMLRQQLAEAQSEALSLQSVQQKMGLLNARVFHLQAIIDRQEACIRDLRGQLAEAGQRIKDSAATHATEIAAHIEQAADAQRTIDQIRQEVNDLGQKLKDRDDEIARLCQWVSNSAEASLQPQSASQIAQAGPSQTTNGSSSISIRRSSRKRTKVEVISDSEEEDVACISSIPSSARISPILTNYASPIPEGRLKIFKDLRGELDARLTAPEFPAGIAHFTKAELASVLGGNKQSLIINIAKGKQKLLSRTLGITGYLCPKLNQNPWCPYAPGRDGYMFVGLGGDAVRLVEPEVRPVFVNVSENHASKLFFAGFYDVCKAEELTKEEWNTVPDHIKRQYSETTRQKVSECRSKYIEQIMSEYNSGSRRAPCRRLRFVGWRNPSDPEKDVYEALVECFVKPPGSVSVCESASVAKRKVEREDVDEEGSPRKMTTRRDK
ncbi:hypothetical protein NEOLEDRAFT_1175141 [Neolentinus lepideus HHB14362 ss-1]|uniref:DUF6697 domain-containing protein n=1 Tax=Neolentinus lepideus HHB14362 ss-1 TaxID=1314782 RepID=A0A165VBY7_9AGAM|nr:hypothetical protein NEOLEDRAFT_1175141 [Neolentinus lepideus HHB14362 ss-1]